MDSSLDQFCEPSSPLYSFWVAVGDQSAVFLGTLLSIDFFLNFRVRPGGGRGLGAAELVRVPGHVFLNILL